MNEDNIGLPTYRMNEIHNMLCDVDVKKSAKVTKEEKKTFLLDDRDVLFNRTNSFEWVGRTGIYYKVENNEHIFASYLVRFVTDDSMILPEYLAAYLSSKQGVWDIKRRARQSINQTNVNPEEIKEIDIPLINMGLQDKIKQCFESAHKLRIDANTLLNAAEEVLLKEVGLFGFKPNSSLVNIKTYKQSFCDSGRLDAEYYQHKYDDLVNVLNKYKHGCEKFSFFIENFSTGFPFRSESYVKNAGVPLIRINNINKGTLDITNAIQIPEADIDLSPNDVALENDILISMSGTIGNSCKIPLGIKAVINQRIMRITPKNYDNEVLPLIVNSIIGNFQLNRIGTGAVQTNISSKDISEIIIPKIPEQKQRQISRLIIEGNSCRNKSNHLLNIAKKSVEIAINENETIALKFITNEAS